MKKYLMLIIAFIVKVNAADPKIIIGGPEMTTFEWNVSAYVENDPDTDADDEIIVEYKTGFFMLIRGGNPIPFYYRTASRIVYRPTKASLQAGGALDWYKYTDPGVDENYGAFDVNALQYDSSSFHINMEGLDDPYSEWINAIALWDNNIEFSVLTYNSMHTADMYAQLVDWDALDYILYDKIHLLYGGLEYDHILGNNDCPSAYSWATSVDISSDVSSVLLPTAKTVSTRCDNPNEERIETNNDRDHYIYSINGAVGLL